MLLGKINKRKDLKPYLSEINMVLVPVSIGELIDKLTILEIKIERITSTEKRDMALNEFKVLWEIYNSISYKCPDETYKELKKVNETLWDIENKKRNCERRQIFDSQFIMLARNVYIFNDKRAEIKRHINTLSESDIIEVKEHV